jgi:hypothetical protein
VPLLEKTHCLRHVAPATGAQLVDGGAVPCSQLVSAAIKDATDRVRDRALVAPHCMNRELDQWRDEGRVQSGCPAVVLQVTHLEPSHELAVS